MPLFELPKFSLSPLDDEFFQSLDPTKLNAVQNMQEFKDMRPLTI